MTTWLSRSLTMIAIGAILAWGVDVHAAYVDIGRVGLVLIAVGGFDLLLNLALLTYADLSRRPAPVPPPPPADRPHVVSYAREPYPPAERRAGDEPTRALRRPPDSR